jgi:hypothetical protein
VKRKRFSVEQIVAVLKQAEIGVPVAELIRQVGSRAIGVGEGWFTQLAVESSS